MYMYVESDEAATVRSSRSNSPACRKASSSIFPMKRALEWCTTAYCSHTARLSTGPRNRVSFHATVGARSTSLYRSCSAASSWSSHCGELPLRTTNKAPMWPLLTLAHCSHECLMPRRRSKYSGADIMPSTTKGREGRATRLEADMFPWQGRATTHASGHCGALFVLPLSGANTTRQKTRGRKIRPAFCCSGS
eukprot:scaffold73597_cov69-Phaeocystis_antarctica.AAC.2